MGYNLFISNKDRSRLVCMIPLNYDFIFPCVSTRGVMRNLQCIPVTCLRGPCFLMAWNIHMLCNLPCAMHGIVTRRIVTHGKATQGIAHMHEIAMHEIAMHGPRSNSHARLATIAINLQKCCRISVHNCKSNMRSEFINSRILRYLTQISNIINGAYCYRPSMNFSSHSLRFWPFCLGKSLTMPLRWNFFTRS